MIPDRFPEFVAGQYDETVVLLPHARMRHMVANVLTEAGIEGVTVNKIGEQIPTSDGYGAEHTRTIIASDEAGADYMLALRRGYEKLDELEQDDVRIVGPGGVLNHTYLDFPARGRLRERLVREHLADVIVPILVRNRHGSRPS